MSECGGCGGDDAQKTEDNTIDGYTFEQEVVLAYEAIGVASGSADPVAEKAFLSFLKDELPALVRQSVDDTYVYINYMDAASPLASCRTIEVGSKNQPKQSRTHKHGTFDYRFETRSAKTVAYIDFCHPQIGAIWGDVKRCAIGAATGAVVAAIIAGNFAVAKAVFYPLFYACLVDRIGNRASEVTVSYRRETEHGCWENHCP